MSAGDDEPKVSGDASCRIVAASLVVQRDANYVVRLELQKMVKRMGMNHASEKV